MQFMSGFGRRDQSFSAASSPSRATFDATIHSASKQSPLSAEFTQKQRVRLTYRSQASSQLPPSVSPFYSTRIRGRSLAITSPTTGMSSASSSSLTGSTTSTGNLWDDFEVVGTKIYDPSGKEFIAKGVNLNGPGFGWPGDSPNQVNNIKQWGFNAIRLNVRELGIETEYKQYAENGTVDQIVQNFTSQGIVVMIDAHEHIGEWFTGSDLTKLQDWYTRLGTQYKDNPYVWLNIANEPGGFDSGTATGINNYLNQHTSTIKTIRATGFDNPIVVDGWYWAQDNGSWNSNPVTENKSAILSLGTQVLAADPLKNTLFSIHCYDQWQYGQAKIDNFIDRVHAKGLALVLGEYGAEKTGNLKATVTSVLPSAQQKEVGRFAWAWWGGDDYELTTSGNGGAQYTNFQSNGAMPTNLSWYGQQVWNDTHRAESLQMRSTSTPTPTSSGSLRVEAENLSLTGYRVESQSAASNSRVISLLQSGLTSGKASGTFNGTAGNYSVKVGYFDENDGISTATVTLAGQTSSFKFDQALGSASSDSTTRTEKTLFSNIALKAGDRFEIAATANQQEWARFDWIEFTPISTTPTPTTPTRPTVLLEAEQMSLSGYIKKSSSYASGGSLIELSSSTQGAASTRFSGASGRYNVILGYVDENDGQSTYTLKLDGTSIGSFVANQNLGASGIDPKTFVSKVVSSGVTINNGQTLRIEGVKNQGELGRVDYIKLIPV